MALNAAQEEVLAKLGAKPEERPRFDDGLANRLLAEAKTGLANLKDDIEPARSLYLGKHQLTMVHGCQVRFLAEEELGFEWSVPLARGSVAHKALELSVFMESRTPIELVNAALGSLVASDQTIADFLAALSETESAELRGLALDSVSAFFEGFPPLRPQWNPVFETRRRVELLDGRVIWAGKFDLTIGNNHGGVAGKAIIDFKTGSTHQSHIDDLRFYALLETFRYQVPPRVVASYYLDSGELAVEEITVGVLEAALARAISGTREIFGLQMGLVEPRLSPSFSCRWCAVLAECEAGQAFLAETH